MSKQKGARIERWFANKLIDIFPGVRRNFYTQTRSGGRDMENTGAFSFECKGGKSYKSKMIRKILDQAEAEAEGKWAVGLVKPDREPAYAVMPFDDFVEILAIMKSEGIL